MCLDHGINTLITVMYIGIIYLGRVCKEHCVRAADGQTRAAAVY